MTLRRSAATVFLASGLVLAMTGCVPTPAPTSPAPDGSTPTPTAVEETPVVEEPIGLSASDIDNIVAALDTDNTAAIEGYLADKVNFILAATECCGLVTPAEAISNLAYVGDAASPWTATPETTVNTYRAGFYVDSFPAGALVFSSADADPYVISFVVIGDHITQIFISNAATMLS